MPCYHPIVAWRSRQGRNKNGKWSIVFKRQDGYVDMEVSIPCGQCIGCRLEKSRQWAIRCLFEASMHAKNCFVTLTYRDEYIVDQSLNKRDMVLFLKKIRKKYGKNIKFLMCGEYGSELNRPHYHICLFGHDFADKKLWSERNGVKLYRSVELEKIWRVGYSTIGDVTFESAAYVARYCLKKINGEKKEEYYNGRVPEYGNMSRRPGIGKTWWDKYKNDILSIDKVVIRNNLTCRPPVYYDKLVGMESPEKLERIKGRRKKQAKKYDWERLRVKEIVKMAQVKNLKRRIEL